MRRRVFVPRDAGAIAVGADRVAAAIVDASKRAELDVEIVRTGSRGLYWLEPMVEVEELPSYFGDLPPRRPEGEAAPPRPPPPPS